jgi:uncharacterized membrane protein
MNVKTRNLLLLAGAAAAGCAIYYGTKREKYSGIKFKKSIVIDRPASELYDFWHDFENLPGISDMLASVEVLDVTRSRWTVAAPGDIPIHWEAEIIKDVRNEMIAWRSVESSMIETAGYVKFEPAPGDRGTLVRVALEYHLPAGKVGAAIATLFGKRPGAHVEEMLRRFKQLLETGEVAVAEKTGTL